MRTTTLPETIARKISNNTKINIEEIDVIFILAKGITPIACKQAHGAVVLCVAQSNRFRKILEK